MLYRIFIILLAASAVLYFIGAFPKTLAKGKYARKRFVVFIIVATIFGFFILKKLL